VTGRPVAAAAAGRLAQRGHEILFEYDAAFIATGLALSPLGLPLRAGVQQEATRIFQGLPMVRSCSVIHIDARISSTVPASRPRIAPPAR